LANAGCLAAKLGRKILEQDLPRSNLSQRYGFFRTDFLAAKTGNAGIGVYLRELTFPELDQ